MSQATEYKQDKSELAHVNFEDIALQLEQCGFEAEVCKRYVWKPDQHRPRLVCFCLHVKGSSHRMTLIQPGNVFPLCCRLPPLPIWQLGRLKPHK